MGHFIIKLDQPYTATEVRSIIGFPRNLVMVLVADLKALPSSRDEPITRNEDLAGAVLCISFVTMEFLESHAKPQAIFPKSRRQVDAWTSAQRQLVRCRYNQANIEASAIYFFKAITDSYVLYIGLCFFSHACLLHFRLKVHEMLMRDRFTGASVWLREAARRGDAEFFGDMVNCLKEHLTNEQVRQSTATVLNTSVHIYARRRMVVSSHVEHQTWDRNSWTTRCGVRLLCYC